MRFPRLPLLAAVVLAAGLGAPTRSVADEESDKSWFVRYVEDTISTPDRKISLGAIEGALSSDVRIASITIADRQGVWLTIRDAHLVWTRLALLQGRLDIDTLEAASIAIDRKPLPPEGLQPAASEGFSVPELPVSVKLGKLSVPAVTVAASVAGQDTTLAVDGGATLEGGKLDAALSITRTKPAGGALRFKADYDNASRELALDLRFDEPKDGFVSTLIGIPGRPALAFSVAGKGPLTAFAADIALAADGAQLLGGKATIGQGETGLIFKADLDGSLDRLVSPAYSDLVAGRSGLSIEGRQTADGGFALQKLAVASGVLNLSATATIAPDGFPTALTADGRIGAADRHPVLLPGTDATLEDGYLTARFGDGHWSASLKAAGLRTGGLGVQDAAFTASGEANALADPRARALTFDLSATTEGLTADDAGLARVLGPKPNATAHGRWKAGAPLDIADAAATLAAGRATFAGRVEAGDVIGRTTLAAPDLSVFSTLADRNLAGRAELRTAGRIALIGGGFSLTIGADAEGLKVAEPAADALLAGRTTLAGGITRDTNGLRLDKLALANPQADLTLDGLYGRKTVDLSASGALADIRVLTDRAAGAVKLAASLRGPLEKYAVATEITSDRLVLQGKPLTQARLAFEGTRAGGALDGLASVRGSLGVLPIGASATISAAPDGALRLAALAAEVGAARLSGDVALAASGRAQGSVTATVPDLAEVAPLLLLKASGALDAALALSDRDGRQDATVKASVRRLTIESVAVGTADLDIAGSDLLRVPRLAGTASAQDVRVDGFAIRTLSAKAAQESNGATALTLAGTLPDGRFSTEGRLAPVDGGFDATLSSLSAAQRGLAVALASPVTVGSRAGTITVPRAVLRVGPATASGAPAASAPGSLTLSGAFGETITLDIDARRIPAALADIASPGLGASGTLSATARVSGPRTAPEAAFSLQGEGLTAAALKGAGVPPLQLSAQGRYAASRVSAEARASGAGGLTLVAKGEIPLSGPRLAVTAQGSAPLALANVFLRDRGARATGTATLEARATGSLAAPEVTGSVRIAGGTLADPQSGTRLTGLGGEATFDIQRLRITRLTAVTAGTGGGGSLGVSGSVALSGDHAADLRVTLRNARLSDGEFAVALVSGDLTVRGPLPGATVLAGRISVARAEVTIPERFPSNATLLGVKHLAPPPEVAKALKRIRAAEPRRSGGRRGAIGLALDLTIDAPGRIFVRGRGIDAELGGQVRLTGPVSAISPVGALRLRRGGLDVIGQHINFESGTITLTGDLDPQIDLVATTRSSNIAVTARVTGSASDPRIDLSSTPELPQDEVLAHFLFGHSIQDLSPLQLVQLATAVAQLAGGSSGPDLLGSIRKSTGLDSLGVVTDASGNAALQAGRYIGENVYLGVTTGAGGETNAAINLDITKSLKARGEVGTSGSKAGLYYEREY